MKHRNVTPILMLTALLASSVIHADDEFYGTIESRPQGNAGTWVVSGRSLDVTDKTRLKDKHGPLVVGACVEVEYEGKVVKKIESEETKKCKK
jgi:hypothetical protein